MSTAESDNQTDKGSRKYELRIVLLGKTGVGKSATGNTILGRVAFKAERKCQRESSELRGQCVTVIDTPGLFDTELSDEEIRREITHCISMILPGPHVFLLLIPLGRFTKHEEESVKIIQETFGEKSVIFTMVLFTRGDDLKDKTLEQCLGKPGSAIRKLTEACGNRVHVFNNNQTGDPTQVYELLEKIDNMVEENGGSFYSCKMFREMERERQERQMKILMDRVITKEEEIKILMDRVREREEEMKRHEEEKERMKRMMEGFEEKLKLIEDDLKRIRVEWREECEREKEEKRICSETNGSLQEANEGINTTETRSEIQCLFHRLYLDSHQIQLRPADVLQITQNSLQTHEPCTEEELVQIFIKKLLMMNYRARYINVNNTNEKKRESEDEFDIFREIYKQIDPMDVQMAVFHSSNGLLKQMMVTKLSQCQFALPLLVPDPDTQQIEFPLWTFRQITKSWKIRNTDTEITSQTQPICKPETPMVFFFRFGPVSPSKSQLMNSLINEKHNTFFHRNCPGSSRTRVLMDGVVEIAWFCPSGANDDKFNDCVAFCNLHGDAGDHEKQLQILSEMASVNVVLLPRLDRDDRCATIIQNLYNDSKPLICLFTDDDYHVIKKLKGKYRIGLKDGNQSEVSEELRKAINDCLLESSSSFRLEDVSKHSDIRVDEEDDEDCRRGRAAAQQMMSLLEKEKLTEIKESFLPHQGKLWHQWSQKNKELHQTPRDETEKNIRTKHKELKIIREQQHKSNISEFMKLFIKEMSSYDQNEKVFFLKWLRILLDGHTSTDLSKLQHKYNEKWSTVSKLKKNHDKYPHEQTKLKRILEKIQAATFGVEHIMREIGQIYESCESVKENKKGLQVPLSSLPSLAAQMMISGFPLELMDGDAAHVPVVWISAVLDQLVQKLGDQRVFVLSVLGLQRSGKSTMLNAMFGLQFAVSAGRCTRGAFMQLVKVSDEMKTQINIDYILVVDIEGLNALELAGRSTTHHDNELATFVVGIAHLTLINIFGENLSEMQDVLQIVVQAFMRMKKVKLNPSCVFVHQNISDITAGEKNMNRRRRLQEKLDEITKLAAKDEVCDAECFSEIIRFDVQKDVVYVPQIWEGNPPMAPPNPKYCENIQELKNIIISQTSKPEGVELTHFKKQINDLWEALLEENSMHIAAYNKLKSEYSKWSSDLLNVIKECENNLRQKKENGEVHEFNETEFQKKLKRENEKVKKSMSDFFEKDTYAEILKQWRKSFENKINELENKLIKETIYKLNNSFHQQKQKKNINPKKLFSVISLVKFP